MIINAQIFLAGLIGLGALIEFGYLFWFGMFDWTILSNDVRMKHVRKFWLLFVGIDLLCVMTNL